MLGCQQLLLRTAIVLTSLHNQRTTAFRFFVTTVTMATNPQQVQQQQQQQQEQQQQPEYKVIDSHLHVWANHVEASSTKSFAYAQPPPDHLQDVASYHELIKRMDNNHIQGALIVQPINHKFDHSYVLSAMESYPTRFKGMLLHNPNVTISEQEAIETLENLALQGFVGVRFNPYLWPKISSSSSPLFAPMSQGTGLAVYRRCAELNMPVGIMCFQGLDLHYDDIISLIQQSPNTKLIIDHMGFTTLKHDDDDDTSDNKTVNKNDDDRHHDNATKEDDNFNKLLSLAKYDNVYVKISALFRLNDQSTNYESVRQERFVPLLNTYKSNRLLFGSDFPYILEQPNVQYHNIVPLVSSWIRDDHDRTWIMGKTCEELFGPWGYPMMKK